MSGELEPLGDDDVESLRKLWTYLRGFDSDYRVFTSVGTLLRLLARLGESEKALTTLREQLAAVTAERDDRIEYIEKIVVALVGGQLSECLDETPLKIAEIVASERRNLIQQLAALQQRIAAAPVSYLIHAADGRLVEQWDTRKMAELEASATWPGSTVNRVRLLPDPESEDSHVEA